MTAARQCIRSSSAEAPRYEPSHLRDRDGLGADYWGSPGLGWWLQRLGGYAGSAAADA
jgi:hypothetical protein